MKHIYIITAILCTFIFSSSIAQQLNITQLGYLPYQLSPGTRISNIGGYVDSQGNEYALMGHPDGLAIIDVTDPVNPYQVFMVPTPAPNVPVNKNNWREVKTMANYAYVVSEAGGGLQIVNLTDLPNSYQQKTWTGDGAINGMLNRSHALHVDDNHVYIYGATGLANGGIIIANVSDPWNPVFAGMYDLNYVHDGYVRNDTIYAAQIYDGTIAIIDVSNKSNPQLVNTFGTPTIFPHNTWLSDDSKTLFTTDENANSFLASFDVSDKQNITEQDRIQSYAGDSSVVHNTHILNDYAVNSWYHDGITIVDGARPANLIEVGYYNLSPLSGPGFNGVWGVYPYLPSGNLLVSHRDSGLYIMSPTYVRGAYLEGIVTDSITGLPLANVLVEILTTNAKDNSKITGEYKTGTAIPGNYDVRFSRAGYHDKIISNISLDNGILTLLDADLKPLVISVEEHVVDYEIILYPNPASNILNINLKNTESNKITLTDLAGKIFVTLKSDKLTDKFIMDISNLSAGFYLLKVVTEIGLVTSKVAVIK
ncbi:MAG: choice-of-anchor B family protein [Bacteroidia bacterium]